MDNVRLRIDEIYVPVKRKRDLDPATVAALAESIMEEGQKIPITVRLDKEKDRLVLVEGLHRLEACRALGEETIVGVVVGSKKF